MERLDVLKKAQRLAYEHIDGVAALSDGEFEDLLGSFETEEDIVAELAHRFLEAADDFSN